MALYEDIKAKANQRSFLTVDTMLRFFLSEIESSGYKIVPVEATDTMVEQALFTTKIGWLDIAGSKLTPSTERKPGLGIGPCSSTPLRSSRRRHEKSHHDDRVDA